MALTHEQLKEAEKRWSEIKKAEYDSPFERAAAMERFTADYNLGPIFCVNEVQEIEQARRLVSAFLQTQSSILACNFAKWACIWAAVAATVAALGAIAAWITVAITL